jgi:hypothetical protein
MKLLLALVLLALAGGAWAQAPQRPAAQAPQRYYYEEYEASQRLRLRVETCARAEDALGAYCVRKCERGYLAASEGALPRRCRSRQPLPPGTLPQGLRKELGAQPVPPARQPAAAPGKGAPAG